MTRSSVLWGTLGGSVAERGPISLHCVPLRRHESWRFQYTYVWLESNLRVRRDPFDSIDSPVSAIVLFWAFSYI